MAVELTVNGEHRTVDALSDTPLLWVLRDDLGLTGTKYSCGIGECGACTVHLDGQPVAACQVSLSRAAGRSVTTIEGLAGDDGGPHPVQAAWVAENVPQCGFCQSGQIMTATAFLAHTPDPDDAAIDAALSGNLCRCGTYQRVRRAVRRAAATMQEAK